MSEYIIEDRESLELALIEATKEGFTWFKVEGDIEFHGKLVWKVTVKIEDAQRFMRMLFRLSRRTNEAKG